METAADVPADAVYLSWRLPARNATEFDALDLAFAVLGQGQTSRLHKELVRRRELAEGSGASTMGLIGGSSFGFAYGRARHGVTPELLEDALVAEVERLGTTGPTNIELRRAKAQFQRQWLHELARVDSRADAVGEYATLLGDPEMVNSRIATVDAIDAGAVADAVSRWFTAEQRATLIYRQEHP